MKITRNGDEVEVTLTSESPLFTPGIHAYDSRLHPKFFEWMNHRAKTIAVMGGRHHIQMIMTFEPEIQEEVDKYLTLVRVAGLQAVETYE
jgi:hypothetical protein